jgi:translocation and assembly module TamB
MSNSFNQDSHSSSTRPQLLWLIIFSRGGLAFGIFLLLAMIGGAWRLQNFVYHELVPVAEKNLTNSLNRPIKLGKVTDFSWMGVKFGGSTIPATATDKDWLTTEGIEVGFDLWQLLSQRRLLLDVTLINPDIYVDQDDQGRWLATKIVQQPARGPINTELDKLRFRNGRLVLAPQPHPGKTPTNQSPVAVSFTEVNGTAKLLEKNRLIKLDLAGTPGTGGSIYIQGDVRPGRSLAGDVRIQTKGLLAAEITRLVKLPLNLQAGRVNGDVQIQLTPDRPTLLFGNASVQGVTLSIPRVPQLLSNSQGNLTFQGMVIKLDQMVTSYGKIPLTATGVIDRQNGFNLAARVNAVSLANAQETLKVKLPFPVVGVVKADVQMGGAISQPVLSGQVTGLKSTRIDKVDFAQLSAKFKLATQDSLLTIEDIQGKSQLGADVRGGGRIKLGKASQLNLNFASDNVPGDAIAQIYAINPGFSIGTVAGIAQITGTPKNVQTFVKWQAPNAKYAASGETIINSDRTVLFQNVAVNIGDGIVRGYGSYANQKWQAFTQAANVKLTPFVQEQKLPNVSLAGARFNGGLDLAGSSGPFKVEEIRPNGAAVSIAGGTVGINQVKLQDQNFAAQLVAEDVRLGQILKKAHPILNAPLTGKFQVAGNRENFSLQTAIAKGDGQLTVDGGQVTAKNIQLADGRYQGQLTLNQVPLPRLANVTPQLRDSRVTGEFNVAGLAESIRTNTIQATGQAKLNVSGGTVTAKNIQLADGRYQAAVTGSGVGLTRLNPQWQGDLAAQLQVMGVFGSGRLADVLAAGEVQFSQGIAGIRSPLNAAIAWNGQKLVVNSATGKDINANGYILADAQKPGIPTITQLNLNVQAKNYNLQNVSLKLPQNVAVTGLADFSGQITGKLTAPNLVGMLGLRNLRVKDFAFEPLLTGNINLQQGQSSSLDVAGKSDRLAVNLSPNNRPNAFLVKWQQASATGRAVENDWTVNVENFPLKALNIALPDNTALGAGGVAGLLSGKFQVNQQTLAAAGNIAIDQPRLARIKGDRFSTLFRYNNNSASLTNSELIKGKSRYSFNANIQQINRKPQIQAKINVSQGQIQDVLAAAQIFDLQDLQRGITAPTYGAAADLTNIYPQGLPNQPLLSQIQRLSELDTLQTNQEEKRLASQPIPDLIDLQGIFNGDIAINTIATKAPTVEFNLQGQNFVWGREQEPNRYYRADKVIAEGNFTNGVLRLQPLRVESKDKLINFAGNIGGKEQSGQLRVKNFPIQVLSNFVKIPVGITGNLNATAAIAGSIANPQARGELNITNGTLNQKKIESANASFSYNNGRLNFGSTVLASGPEPVNVTGSIPYKLPFASLEPESNQINLDVKVKDEGLALLNLFTNEISFEDGEGELDLTIRGTRRQPLVKGIASLNNASFSAQALPGKLTNVSGKAQFDFDRVVVESFQGKYSNGKVEAAGEIPIFTSQNIKINNPLNVNLEKLVLNLKGLYQGGASGNLQINGSLLNPVIGGNIELVDGLVLVAEASDTNTADDDIDSSLKVNKQNKSDTNIRITKLDNLELKLGRNVKIARPPIFNFLASGNLTVNGFLSNPIPEGTIKLTQGGVNLFTTQLNLARGYDNSATFRSSQPRNPDLNLRLFAKVLDVIQNVDISRQGTGLSTLETVRVEANIKGSASKINDNLELKSSPSRSETEIVTLLGGGFVDTQGRADSTLGLINIAGSAVFNNFQSAFNQIGSAFGLSELRLFPTIIADRPEAPRSNSSLELALEAGVDISSKFSISGIKILTTDDPFQWGINYRINDEFRLRSSTNLTDDSRAVIEFERRF